MKILTIFILSMGLFLAGCGSDSETSDSGILTTTTSALTTESSVTVSELSGIIYAPHTVASSAPVSQGFSPSYAAETMIPLSGAQIRIRGTSKESITDANGRYSFLLDETCIGPLNISVEKGSFSSSFSFTAERQRSYQLDVDCEYSGSGYQAQFRRQESSAL